MRLLLRFAVILAGLLLPASISHGQVFVYGSGLTTGWGLPNSTFGLQPFGASAFNAAPFGISSIGLNSTGFTTLGAVPFGVQTLGVTSFGASGYTVRGRHRAVITPPLNIVSMPGRIVVPIAPGSGFAGGGLGGSGDSSSRFDARFDSLDRGLVKINDTLEKIQAKLSGDGKVKTAPAADLPSLSPDDLNKLKAAQNKLSDAAKRLDAANKALDDAAKAWATDTGNKALHDAAEKAGRDKAAVQKEFQSLMSNTSP